MAGPLSARVSHARLYYAFNNNFNTNWDKSVFSILSLGHDLWKTCLPSPEVPHRHAAGSYCLYTLCYTKPSNLTAGAWPFSIDFSDTNIFGCSTKTCMHAGKRQETSILITSHGFRIKVNIWCFYPIDDIEIGSNDPGPKDAIVFLSGGCTLINFFTT